MTSAFSRMGKLVANFARWYRTPVGMLSLFLLLATAGLVAFDATRWAMLVALVWMATIVPHKLMREHRDRDVAIQMVGRQNQEILDLVKRDVSRINADMHKIPTLEEIKTWQSSVEQAQVETNSSLMEAIELLDRRLST